MGKIKIITIAIYIALAYGYVTNIVKFVQCDFESPYKAEVVRGIGIVIPPVGVVCGYLTIKD